MSATITEFHTITFQQVRCGECDALFFLTQSFYDARRNDGGTFYCPNGHPRVFSESVQTRLDKAQAEASSLRTRWIAADEQRMAAERANERLKRRIKAGVCPCCQRSFQNLCRHIKTKHPNYAK